MIFYKTLILLLLSVALSAQGSLGIFASAQSDYEAVPSATMDTARFNITAYGNALYNVDTLNWNNINLQPGIYQQDAQLLSAYTISDGDVIGAVHVRGDSSVTPNIYYADDTYNATEWMGIQELRAGRRGVMGDTVGSGNIDTMVFEFSGLQASTEYTVRVFAGGNNTLTRGDSYHIMVGETTTVLTGLYQQTEYVSATGSSNGSGLLLIRLSTPVPPADKYYIKALDIIGNFGK